MRTEKEVRDALEFLSTWPKDSGYYGGYRNALRYVLEESPLDDMLQETLEKQKETSKRTEP